MSYAYELENGQQLVIENSGDRTQVALSSGSKSQQQSQATGFDTGKWSKAPALYRLRRDLILRVETKDGAHFIRVRGDEIQRVKSEPDLEKAEKLRLKKSDRPAGMKPMEPMKPMRPMEPMKPMEQMKPMSPPKPLRRIRPMEMRMGDMHMQMGGGEMNEGSAQRFCPQCGASVREGDRFCSGCGAPLDGK